MKRTVITSAGRTAWIIAATLILSAPAWSDSFVLSTTGEVEMATLTGSLLPGAQENQFQAILLSEWSNLPLPDAITVDAVAPGVYDAKTKLTPGLIAAGTTISSSYLHIDPVTSGTPFSGSITFSHSILGVISTAAGESATDALLGDAAVQYPTNDVARGFELSPTQDQFSISSDLRTLTFSTRTWGATDDLRIIVAGTSALGGASQISSSQISEAPEPGTLVIFALGLAGIAVSRLRR